MFFSGREGFRNFPYPRLGVSHLALTKNGETNFAHPGNAVLNDATGERETFFRGVFTRFLALEEPSFNRKVMRRRVWFKKFILMIKFNFINDEFTHMFMSQVKNFV